MGVRARRLLLGFLVAVTAGCTAFDASKGAEAPADAGADVDSLPSSDDGGAGTDAAASPDAAPSDERCSRAESAWCDNFDRETLLGGWQSTQLAEGGTLTLETRDVGGRALVFRGPPRVRSTGYLQRTLTELGTPGKFTVRYTLRADSLPNTPTEIRTQFAALAELRIPAAGGTTQRILTTLNEIAGTLRVQYGVTPSTGPSNFSEVPLGSFPLNSWNEVRIHVDLVSKSVAVETSFGGPVSIQLSDVAKKTMIPGVITALIGASYANVTESGWTLSMDDYVVAIDP